MRAVLAIALGLLVLAPHGAVAEPTMEELTAGAEDSLVFIATRYFDPNTGQTKPAGVGSGFVITAGGLVLTAYHVIRDWYLQNDDDKLANPLRVRLGSSHGDEVDAGVVGVNEQYDVALLKILKPGTYKPTGVCFATSLVPGEAVVAFGFPSGLERTASPGTFANASADNGRWAVSFNNEEGMSGGPLYDRFGDVVGIIRGTYGGQGASNVVTPVRRAKGLIDEQTSFDEDCRRDAPPTTGNGAPTPNVPAADGWYGGSLWRHEQDYCADVRGMIAATADTSVLHYAGTGAPVTEPVTGAGWVNSGYVSENLLFTEASNNQPLCGITPLPPRAGSSDTAGVECDLDVTVSFKTFQAIFGSAADDLGRCLAPLNWRPADAGSDCRLSSGAVDCSAGWSKSGHEARLYGFSSGSPPIYGLGVYFPIPAK